MDSLDLLTADHNRFRGRITLFEQASEADDVGRMADVADRLFEDLEIHTRIEEEIFYPGVHDLSEEIGETVDEGIQEHHVADVLVAEMRSLEPGSDEWNAKMEVLVESVEHHLHEEEDELFPAVRSKTDAGWREDLGRRMDDRRSELGFPTVAEREKLGAEELQELARQQEIPGRSQMSKEELAATVDTR